MGEKRITLMIVVAVAAVVTAVLAWPDEETTPPRDTATQRPAPTLKPLQLADNPLWTAPEDVMWAEERDGLMLFGHGDLNLSLYDANGAPRWTMEKMHDLGGVASSATFNGGPDERHLTGHGVLVQYNYTADCQYPDNPPRSRGVCHSGPDDESGLTLVSTMDGRVVWRTPVLASYPDVPLESRPEITLRVADDRVAIVSVLNGLVHSGYDKGTQLTVAIDTRTGAKLWERADGVWPMWIVGDTVLGVRSARLPAAGIGDDPAGMTVVATDLATGEQRWERAGSRLVTVAGDVAMVDDGSSHFTAVTAVDGKTVGTLENADRMEDCDTDGTALIVCLLPDDGRDKKLTTFDVAGRRSGTPAAAVSSLDGVRAERIFVTGRRAGDPTAFRPYTLDSVGNEIDRELDLPGEIVLLTNDRAILSNDEHGDVTTEVYEVLAPH